MDKAKQLSANGLTTMPAISTIEAMTKKKQMPTTDDAEKWITPEVFEYQRKRYRVLPNCQVVADKSKRGES